MKLDLFPMYCGGRILKGIYNEKVRWVSSTERKFLSNDEVMKKLIEHSLDFTCRQNSQEDNCPTIPDNLDDFQKILTRLVTSPVSYTRDEKDGRPLYQRVLTQIGVILAVTNNNQTRAADFLRQTGFKVVATTSKVRAVTLLEDGETLDPSEQGTLVCKTWLVDVRGVLYPKLEPILQELNAKYDLKMDGTSWTEQEKN